MADYASQIFKRPDTGELYSLVNGVARTFQDQQAAQALAPNAQSLAYGTNTNGYDAQHGGGTTGGAWTVANFQNTVDTLSNQGGGTNPVTPYTNPQQINTPAGSLGTATGTPTSMTTPEFATQFQEKNGRAPTQQELQGFLANRGGAQVSVPSTTQSGLPTATESPITASKSPGAGYIRGYDTNNSGAPVWVKSGQYYPGVSLYPEKTGGINASTSFNQEKPIDLSGTGGTGQSGVADSAASVAAKTAVDDIKATQELYKQTQTTEQKQASDLGTQLSSFIAGEKGKTAYTNEQTAKLVDPIQAQLTTVNNQITALVAEKEKFRIDQEGKPITLSSITGSVAANNAKLNGEILTLTAQANALMGNITLAQKQVAQAVDAKYGPNEEAIAIAQAQLAALKPTLDAQDKIQADAVAAQHTAALKAIEDAKTKEKDIQTENLNALNEYIKAGGKDQSVISQIQSNKVSGGALSLASSQISTNASLDTQLKQAQLSKTKAEAAKAWADTSQNTPEIPPVDKNSQSILAQTGINSTVFNYLTQGTSALSRMTAAGRAQVQKEADAFLNKNGLDYSTFQSRYKAYNDVLQKNLERANNTSIYASEVAGTVDQFVKDFNPADVKQGGYFGIGNNKLSIQNVIDLLAGKQVNNPLAVKYSFDIHTMANDLAGYLAASRGANVPENADIASAAGIIANGINTGSAEAFKKSIQDNEAKVTGVVNGAVEAANRKVWDLFGVGQNYNPIVSTSETHNGITLPGSDSTFNGIALPHS